MPIIYAPEIPQWSPTANRYRTDCGPACVAMLLSLYGKLGGLTVDALAAETGLRFSDSGLLPTALVKLGAAHGLALTNKPGTSLDDIRASIIMNRPVTALVAYRFITGRLDQADDNPVNDGHYFVILGFDDNHFVVNDPDYWPPYVERGHETLVPIRDLDLALAGDSFNSQCLFLESVPVTDQIIALAKQIEALAAQLNVAPATPPPVATGDKLAVVVAFDGGTNVRQKPTTSSPVVAVLDKGAALNVVDAKITADGHAWDQIADGQYLGFYIAQDKVTPTVPVGTAPKA